MILDEFRRKNQRIRSSHEGERISGRSVGKRNYWDNICTKENRMDFMEILQDLNLNFESAQKIWNGTEVLKLN